MLPRVKGGGIRVRSVRKERDLKSPHWKKVQSDAAHTQCLGDAECLLETKATPFQWHGSAQSCACSERADVWNDLALRRVWRKNKKAEGSEDIDPKGESIKRKLKRNEIRMKRDGGNKRGKKLYDVAGQV